jgi:asparagine synthase (glutamine-hydrolysing)
LVGLRVGLPDEMLTKLDRTTMAIGLEARVPLLDDDVVSTALSFAPSALVSGPHGKMPLRLLVERNLGRSHAALEKRGFNTPLGSRISSDPTTRADAERRWAQIGELPIFAPDGVAGDPATLALAGQSDRVYATLVMAQWLQKNQVHL